MRAVVWLLWLPLNLVQAALVIAQLVFWVSVAFVVRMISGRTDLALGLARWCWAPGVLAVCATRIESVEGVEAVDWSRPYMIAANHSSFLDIPVLFRVLPANLCFIVKRELAKVPFLSWYVRGMGMVFVDRSDPEKAKHSVERVAKAVRERTFLVFPEGTRSADGGVKRFKSGMLAAASVADAPILPVAIEGTHRGIPRATDRIRPTRVRVAVGQPIDTSAYGPGDRRQLARDVEAEVVRLHAGLSAQRSTAVQAAKSQIE